MNSQIIIVLIIFFGLVATIIFLFSKALIRKKNPINNSEIKNTSTLITCRDCKKEISINAETCPHCGARLKTSFLYKFIKWGLIIAAIFFVFQIILAIVAYNTI